jgi:hypothetical protein
VHRGLSHRWSAWSARACLLAWLVLAWGGAAPALYQSGIACPIESEQEDAAPEDAPPAGDESLLDASIEARFLLKRAYALARSGACTAIGQRPGAGRDGAMPGESDPGPGHFLGEGRSLRLCLGSLTC